MNKINALVVTLLLFSLCSCKTYLTPAVLGHNMGYMARPLVIDSINSKTYANASYSGSSSPEKNVEFEMGILNIHRGHTYKHINFSYGIMGYVGTAKYSHALQNGPPTSGPPILPDFNKSISGVGLRTSIGFHDVSESGNTDYRLLNWENSLSKESGSYTAYRRQLPNGLYEGTYVSKMETVLTTGLSSEIAWQNKKNKNFTQAHRLFLGWTPGLAKSFDTDLTNTVFTDYTANKPKSRLGFAYSYFLKYKRVTFTCEFSSNVNVAGRYSFGYCF